MAEDVVGLAEIAEMLGVTRRTAQRYIARGDLGFPEPYARLAGGRLWRRRDVEKWARRHLPLPPGRPPQTSE